MDSPHTHERTPLRSPVSPLSSYSSEHTGGSLLAKQSTSIQARTHHSDEVSEIVPPGNVASSSLHFGGRSSTLNPNIATNNHLEGSAQESDASYEHSGQGQIHEETGQPAETYTYDPQPSIGYTQAVQSRQQEQLASNTNQPPSRRMSILTQRVMKRARSKFFAALMCVSIFVFIVLLTGYAVGVSLTYPQCEDLYITQDVYSNNTVLVSAGVTRDCHSSITATSISTNDHLDQQIDLYVTPCSDLKYYGFPNNKQFITLSNWTASLRLFDNSYWTVGSNMSIDVSASVLAGQSSVIYVCIFDSSKYFKEFIGYNDWKDAAKNALNCSISNVNSIKSTETANFSFKVSQSKYYYIGLRPTSNLATLDLHTHGIEYFFNRSDYTFTNCTVSLKQPCTFAVPSDSSEQCVLAFSVPPADVTRGYSSVRITSPKQNDITFIGASAGAGVFILVVLIALVISIVCYLVLPSCRREADYEPL